MPELRGKFCLLAHGIMILACLMILLPFLWIFLNSIKYPVDIYTGSLQFQPTLSNYSELLFTQHNNFLRNTRNSIAISISSTIIVMVVSSLAAYALSRFRWPTLFRAGLLNWILLFHMIPPITLVAPWYLLFSRVGLYNNLLGVALAHVTLNLPLATWLMLGFLRDVPSELEEAAFIDGCGRIGAFLHIVLPLVVPGLIAGGILSFIFSWNEFLVALTLTSVHTSTIPVGIAKFAQENIIRYGEMAASAIYSTIPAIALVAFGQRFIVKGLTLGALK